jgi:hypothetical protein
MSIDLADHISIDEALRDPALFGAALGSTDTWSTWLATLKAAFGIALNREERRAFEAIAGSRKPPRHKVQELWCLVGRGGGKSRMAAAIACYIACFIHHDLDPGEIGYVLCLAASKDQASIVFKYCLAFLKRSPILQPIIKRVTSSEITLNNRVVIACHANSFRSIRGRSLLALVADETAYWRDESSANPDREVYIAVKPALVRCHGMLVGISTVYRKSGLLYAKYCDHYGKDDDAVLVVKGPTTVFNPTIDQQLIAQQMAADPEAARSEWESELRPLELPPRPGLRYRAFTDASAGRCDGFSFASRCDLRGPCRSIPAV